MTLTATKKPRQAKPKALSAPEKVYPVFHDAVGDLCRELQKIQRRRASVMKLRLRQSNSVRALVAVSLGYRANMEDKERKTFHGKAQEIIDAIRDKKEGVTCDIKDIVETSLIGLGAFDTLQDSYEKDMKEAVRGLPQRVLDWAYHKDRRGFSSKANPLQLAIILGETGDLRGYHCPQAVWRRLSCHPHTYLGETQMGATWRMQGGKEGKLPAAEWVEYGYNKRRRSIAYLVGVGLMKQNYTCDKETKQVNWLGPYRQRYNEAKLRALDTHPDWDISDCDKCGGGGAVEGVLCSRCSGSGKKCGRAHMHSMLLASKKLLKDLWVVFNDRPVICPRWGV